jgi:sulfoxide reductase heme-binding subunit YedZ
MQIKVQTRFCPWLDRAGRLSWLKLVVFAFLFVPGAGLAVQWSLGMLMPQPVTEAIHETGEWAVRFLVASLAITPLRRIGQWSKLIAVRRMIGVAALIYALIHLVLYIVSQKWSLLHVATEIVLRFYLTIGFVALLGLVALGITSTDGMIRRLGARRWNRLHSVVYGLAVLGLLHYGLQSKIDVTAPMLLAGLFILLMGQRLLQRFGLGESLWALTGLALGSGLATALLEALWYLLRNGIPADQVLGANLDFDSPLRPAWWVAALGLLLLIVRLARRFWARAPAVRAPKLRNAAG